eukprot:GHUV01005988.1.p1 GENE.GHUV01005988.1~~GHUV01005988.1.p1  ORF type:complete len:178 (+),score=37.66 GHUV01005988.1:261-794(+)
MAALVFKLGALALKTLAKPLGDRFKNWVMIHPQYRQTVLRMAQRVHGFEVAITRKAEGRTGKAFIGNMTEEKSVELASKIASESFLFVVGSLIVFVEYDRQRRKDIRKQRKEAAERQSILERAREERERLIQENVQQQQILQQLIQRLENVEQALQVLQAEKDKKGLWGGFLGPRGL